MPVRVIDRGIPAVRPSWPVRVVPHPELPDLMTGSIPDLRLELSRPRKNETKQENGSLASLVQSVLRTLSESVTDEYFQVSGSPEH